MSLVDPNYPLLHLSDGPWTVDDSLKGTHIFGGTGSGKTSGSGQTIALSMLKSGMGGLVLTVKPDELDEWKAYCRYANRESDLEVFGPEVGPESNWTFNFLEYEREQVFQNVEYRFPEKSVEERESIATSFLTENLVNLFSTLMEVAKKGQGGGGNNDAYWMSAVRQLLRNAVEMLNFSGLKLSFQNLHDIIMAAPSSQEEANNLREELAAGEGRGLFAETALTLLNLSDDHPRIEDAILVLNYWMKEFSTLAAETRSIILSFYTTASDPFLRGTLRRLFSPDQESPQLRPEMTREGKVLLLNLPVKEYFETGQFAQVLYKYIFQRSCERTSQKEARPVFLWADEAQFFLSSKDMLFQTTARSSKVATVYLTQNLSNYYALMPGEQGKAQTDSLLGNFVTKIFHNNTDSVSNIWGAELISKTQLYRRSMSSSDSSSDRNQAGNSMIGNLFSSRSGRTQNLNYSQREEFDYQVPPIEFTKLRSGGKENQFIVDAIFTQGGSLSSDGKNFQQLQFIQFYPE